MNKRCNIKLRALMVENSLTQNDMAKKLKMGASTFNRKLNGAAPWYYHECVLVSKLFGKSVAEIFPAEEGLARAGDLMDLCRPGGAARKKDHS